MNAATDVLYEKFSISSVTFFMSLWIDLSSSLVGASSDTFRLPSLSVNMFHIFLMKRWQPSMPLVSQGFDCSSGPRNISYMRRVSAPYLSMITSGLTTLNMDLLIFSTAHPQMYLPFSRMNSALLYSGRQFLNASTSRTSALTMFTSTWMGVVSYWSLRPYETNVLVSLMRYTKLLRPWIIPWLMSLLNGSSTSLTPRSLRNLFQKRE